MMQPQAHREPSALARLCARIGGLPLGGFAAPPPALFDDPAVSGDVAPSRARVGAARRPTSELRRPIRWTTLSAVR